MPKILECFSQPNRRNKDRITTTADKNIIGCDVEDAYVSNHYPYIICIRLMRKDGASWAQSRTVIVALENAYQYCTLNKVALENTTDALKCMLSVLKESKVTAFNIIDDSTAVLLFDNGGELLIKADIEDGTIGDAFLMAPFYPVWSK